VSARSAVILLGGSGLVGSRLRELWSEDFELIAPAHAELDVLDNEALAAFLANTRAPVVVNSAAWADVDGAETERGNHEGRVYALNARYPAQLATLCGELQKHLIHLSTDYVFGGTSAARPYRETDPAGPLSWYAQTKFGGEEAVLSSGAPACVARIEMPFSAQAHPKPDLARHIVGRIRRDQPVIGVVDQRVTPVFIDDAARALRLLLDARFGGLIHIAAADWTTPLRFARTIAQRLKLNADLVEPETFANFAATRAAPRPQHSWLDVSRFASLFGPGVLRSPEAEVDAWAEQVLAAPERV
jgi:dTDP-4-dehydrorhamnose reductase